MKASMTKSFNGFAIVIFLMPFLSFGPKVEKTKTITKTISVNQDTKLSLTNKRGSIKIINTEGSEVKIESVVTVKSKKEEEINKVFEAFEVSVDELGAELDVTVDDNIKSWYQAKILFTVKNEIKFDDGSTARDIEDIDVEMTVYMPTIKKLKINTKYNNVHFDKINNDLEVDMYSGKLKGNEINGNFKLDQKYGEISVGSFKDGDIDIYDCTFTALNGHNVELDSKYSEISLGNTSSLDFESYDDEVELGNIDGEFELDAKYTEFNIGNIGEAEMSIYDCDLEGKDVVKLTLDSKYSGLEFKNIGSASLDLYDDDLDFKSINDLVIKESKYSSLDVDQFSCSMDVRSSYEDEIRVENVDGAFTALSFEGKYTDLHFPIPQEVGYKIDAEITYGDLEYNDKSQQGNFHSNNDKSKLKALINGGNDNSAKIELESYSGHIVLK